MKKIAFILALLMLTLAFAACGKDGGQTEEPGPVVEASPVEASPEPTEEPIELPEETDIPGKTAGGNMAGIFLHFPTIRRIMRIIVDMILPY